MQETIVNRSFNYSPAGNSTANLQTGYGGTTTISSPNIRYSGSSQEKYFDFGPILILRISENMELLSEYIINTHYRHKYTGMVKEFNHYKSPIRIGNYREAYAKVIGNKISVIYPDLFTDFARGSICQQDLDLKTQKISGEKLLLECKGSTQSVFCFI